MHLSERSGRRRVMLEAGKFFLPPGAELSLHAALDKGPAHGRCFALQLGQFGGVFGRQRIRDGGQELRHLHDRPFQPAERRRQLHRIAGAIERKPEQPRARQPRRHAAHIGADARIARGPGGEAVFFAVGHGRADSADGPPRAEYSAHRAAEYCRRSSAPRHLHRSLRPPGQARSRSPPPAVQQGRTR